MGLIFLTIQYLHTYTNLASAMCGFSLVVIHRFQRRRSASNQTKLPTVIVMEDVSSMSLLFHIIPLCSRKFCYDLPSFAVGEASLIRAFLLFFPRAKCLPKLAFSPLFLTQVFKPFYDRYPFPVRLGQQF
jgi:hypothetical protein